jgi:hypothetical protein
MIENVFPRAIQAGQAVELQVFGRNLGAGAQQSPWKISDLTLDVARIAVTGSTDLVATGEFRFREHPTHHSVQATAATCTLIGEQVMPFDANPQTILVTDTPTSVEVEPNDTREQAMTLSLPAVVSARFDRERDLDWYTFETDETGGSYEFEVYCERIAGRAQITTLPGSTCDREERRRWISSFIRRVVTTGLFPSLRRMFRQGCTLDHWPP